MFGRGRSREAASPEVAASKEALTVGKRIVVFGANMNGLHGVGSLIEQALAGQGVEGMSVVKERDGGLINEAFYGSSDDLNQTLPAGVVVLPEMRQYDFQGHGMFIDEHREFLEQRCRELGVPFVYINTHQPDAESFVRSGIAELLADAIPPATAE